MEEKMAFGNNKEDYTSTAQTGFGAHPETKKTKDTFITEKKLNKKTKPKKLSPRKIDYLWNKGSKGFLWDHGC
jgi:hypothetical protein